MISRLPKTIELSQEWVLTTFRYQGLGFMLDYLMSQKKGLFEVPGSHKKISYKKICTWTSWVVTFAGNKKCSCVLFLFIWILIVGDNLLMIVVQMQLKPQLKQMAGSKFLNMQEWNLWEIRVKNDADSHIKYLSNNMDMINCLKHICF